MQIKHHHTPDDGMFYIDDNGQRLGDMRYMITDDGKMDIYHTEVEPEAKGQGLGKQLIEAGVNYARKGDMKIIPSCTFAQTVFAGHSEFKDVLADQS